MINKQKGSQTIDTEEKELNFTALPLSGIKYGKHFFM